MAMPYRKWTMARPLIDLEGGKEGGKEPPLYHTQEKGRNSPEVQATNYEEPGARIWIPYLEHADKYDRDLVEGWRDDMDAMLIFAGLFSAVLTAFVIESYQRLQENPTDRTNALLLQISQQLANSSQAPAATSPQPFQPTASDIAINVYWFLSLGFALSCSLGAVLVRQWAWDFLRFPRGLPSVTKRARMRQYLFSNMERWRLKFFVEMIPTLLHISLFLFFIGLLIFLRTVHERVALYMLCFCSIGLFVYVVLTISPHVVPGCPYGTPLSLLLVPTVRLLWKVAFLVVMVPILIMVAPIFYALELAGLNTYTPPVVDWADELLHETVDSSVNWRIDPIWYAFYRATVLFNHYSLEERRLRSANRETDNRDAEALKWTFQASSVRSETLIAVVEALPEYVPSNVSPTQTRLLSLGVLPNINRLLASCVGHSHVGLDESKQGTISSCLQSIVWLTRCPVDLVRDKTPNVHGLLPVSSKVGDVDYTDSVTTWRALGADNLTSSFARQCLAIVVMRQCQQLDLFWPVFHSPLDGFLNEAQVTHLKELLEGQCRVTLDHVIAASEGSATFVGEDGESLFRSILDETPHSSSLTNWLRITLQDFSHLVDERDRAVGGQSRSKMLTLVVSAVSDAISHLKVYPDIDAEVQSSIFGFVDSATAAGLRETDGSFAYQHTQRRLLFDTLEPFAHSTSLSREDLHSNFFDRVLVLGRTADGNRSAEVGGLVPHFLMVGFKVYCGVLAELSGCLDHEADSASAHARAIRSLIASRSTPSRAVGTPIMTDDGTPDAVVSALNVVVEASDEHLSVVRRLLAQSAPAGLHRLLHRTAGFFGYEHELERAAPNRLPESLCVPTSLNVDGSESTQIHDTVQTNEMPTESAQLRGIPLPWINR